MLLMASITVLLKCKLVLFNPPPPPQRSERTGLGMWDCASMQSDWDFVKIVFPLLVPGTIPSSHTPTPHLDKKYEGNLQSLLKM